MWPRVHIIAFSICSTCVSKVEGVYMDLIKVRVHREANLWQTQRNLVGTCEYGWVGDLEWFPMTTRYCLFDQKHKRGTWHLHTNLALSIESWVCAHLDDVFLFLVCK
jgi:hypothetical protein